MREACDILESGQGRERHILQEGCFVLSEPSVAKMIMGVMMLMGTRASVVCGGDAVDVKLESRANTIGKHLILFRFLD